MPPTVYLAELPMTGCTVNAYIHQRQRIQNVTNLKKPILELKTGTANEVPLTSKKDFIWKVEYANTVPQSFIPHISMKFPASMDDQCRKLVATRKDLLSIVIRTITLVRRNRILQRRVNALRAETRRFLHSVLSNPENKCQQQRLQVRQCEDDTVSSSTEKVALTSSLLDANSTSNSFHEITSTCDNCDRTYDKLPSDKFEYSRRNIRDNFMQLEKNNL